MINNTKFTCSHCEAKYLIKWEDVEIEPDTCPFCGSASGIEFEDDNEVIYNSEDEEDNNWN